MSFPADLRTHYDVKYFNNCWGMMKLLEIKAITKRDEIKVIKFHNNLDPSAFRGQITWEN